MITLKRATRNKESEPKQCTIDTDQKRLSTTERISQVSFYATLTGLGVAQLSPSLLHAVGITDHATVVYTKHFIESHAIAAGIINLAAQQHALRIRNHLTSLLTRHTRSQENKED